MLAQNVLNKNHFINKINFSDIVFQNRYWKKSKCVQVKALFTRDILTHNIAIKRYFDKNIFLSHGCLKAKLSS